MPQKLVVLAGPDEGRVFPLGSEALLLGRSRATGSHLIDPHVARVHCQVQTDGDQTVVSDFDSEGGTFVNGQRAERHVLKPGDIIRIGNTRLQFVVDLEETAPPPTQELPVAQPIGVPRTSLWAHDLPGQKVSHYKVGSLLARGKTGYVFHARDTRRNLAVALKVLDPSFSKSDTVVQHFVDAMKTVLPLRHPNLVKVYGAGKASGSCWVAMEYVPGESLAAVIGRIAAGDMLDWRDVLRVGLNLARALEYAHGKNLVHQSVQPMNILLGKTRTDAKLADLMLAAAVEGDPTTPISAAGVPSEELSYMPPERTDGPGRAVDARADIYSLGATLYAMFTGHPPLQADTVRDLVVKIRRETPMSLKSHQLGLPETLEHINQKMLAKRPEDRYQSATDLVKHLETFAKSHNVRVSALTRVTRLQRPPAEDE